MHSRGDEHFYTYKSCIPFARHDHSLPFIKDVLKENRHSQNPNEEEQTKYYSCAPRRPEESRGPLVGPRGAFSYSR